MAWLFLLIAAGFEVTFAMGMKYAEGFTRLWPSLAVVFCYALAFYCLSITLRTLPVGIAYAVWAGAGIVLIALIGRVLFGQLLDAPALLGIGLILAGVVVINVFSSSVQH